MNNLVKCEECHQEHLFDNLSYGICADCTIQLDYELALEELCKASTSSEMNIIYSDTKPEPLILKPTVSKYDPTWMNLAISLSKHSSCSRLQVGAVLVSLDDRNVLAVGYNGNAQGLTNGCDRDVKGNCGCAHAEVNTALKNKDLTTQAKMYVTHLPCEACAKVIINMGNVKEVVYLNDYTYLEVFELFNRTNIKIRKYEA